MKKLGYLLFFIFVLAACSKSDETSNEQPNNEFELAYPAEIEITEGDFTYRLFTEKDVYDEYGDTAIFAELTYVGNEDSIDIYHSASPFYFTLEERTRGFKVDYPMDQPLMISTLKKDETIREKYIFSGGYNDTADPKYVEFVQTIMDKGFPKGNYIINSSAQFYITNPDNAADTDKFDINTMIGFTVAEGLNN